ncbi:MAG: hypothetical protein ACTSQ8_11165 [Candidatus Helarchaeota archaeon]
MADAHFNNITHNTLNDNDIAGISEFYSMLCYGNIIRWNTILDNLHAIIFCDITHNPKIAFTCL